MSDMILASGFTPLIDCVVKDTSLMTAVVYGLVYRHSQMRNHVCSASIDTLAKEASVSRHTIQRHLAELVKKGYIKDLTPGLTGYPHNYVPTDKVSRLVEVRFEATNQSLTEEVGDVAESDGGYATKEQGVSQNGTRDVPQWNTKRLLRDNINKQEREALTNLINNEVEVKYESMKDNGTPLKGNNVMIKRDPEEENINDKRTYLKDDQLTIKDPEEENNNRDFKEEKIKKKPRERNDKTVVLSERQRIVLEELGKPMHLIFTPHKDAKELANFLISAYAKRQGPNQYAEWAIREGMHRDQISKYAAFPLDIMREYPQAFADQYQFYYGENYKDTQLFANELKDFVPVMSDETLDV